MEIDKKFFSCFQNFTAKKIGKIIMYTFYLSGFVASIYTYLICFARQMSQVLLLDGTQKVSWRVFTGHIFKSLLKLMVSL